MFFTRRIWLWDATLFYIPLYRNKRLCWFVSFTSGLLFSFPFDYFGLTVPFFLCLSVFQTSLFFLQPVFYMSEWQSGRLRLPAKQLPGESWAEGSNPSSDARPNMLIGLTRLWFSRLSNHIERNNWCIAGKLLVDVEQATENKVATANELWILI